MKVWIVEINQGRGWRAYSGGWFISRAEARDAKHEISKRWRVAPSLRIRAYERVEGSK